MSTKNTKAQKELAAWNYLLYLAAAKSVKVHNPPESRWEKVAAFNAGVQVYATLMGENSSMTAQAVENAQATIAQARQPRGKHESEVREGESVG